MLPLGNIIRKYGISFHCYAEDTQLYISTRPDESSKLYKECVNVQEWMAKNVLLLNSDKTDILLIGPKKQYAESLGLQFATIRIYCYFLYSQKSGCYIRFQLVILKNHIFHVTKTAFFHLLNIAKLRNMLTVSFAEKLVHAFMTSRLDYCTTLLRRWSCLFNKLATDSTNCCSLSPYQVKKI